MTFVNRFLFIFKPHNSWLVLLQQEHSQKYDAMYACPILSKLNAFIMKPAPWMCELGFV